MSKVRKGIKGKQTILLVDDDSYFRFAIATELRAAGYLVVCAEDGERGIRMFEDRGDPAKTYDIVITDLVMPRKDGLRFCHELRSIDPDIPVLVITGYLSAEIERELKKSGCADVLEKPFSPDELIKKVQGLLLVGVIGKR